MNIPALRCTGRQRTTKPATQLAFLWRGPDVLELGIDELRDRLALGELEGFDSDLQLVGRVHVLEHDDGSLHHVPVLYFVEIAGHA